MESASTIEGVTIKKPVSMLPAEDYAFLRKEGIDYLQRVSGKVWNDYNVHDPGVTMLELLCYAITETAYRTNFNTADLLTAEGKTRVDKTDAFFTPKEILPNHPLTYADYKKLVLDRIPTVRNVWFVKYEGGEASPKEHQVYFDPTKNSLSLTDNLMTTLDYKIYFNGLYKVKVELESSEALIEYLKIAEFRAFVASLNIPVFPIGGDNITVDTSGINIVIKHLGIVTATVTQAYYLEKIRVHTQSSIKKLLHQNRNLCEDFYSLEVIKDYFIGVCLDIDLLPDADVYATYKEVYGILYNYVSPKLKVYSLEELLDKKKTIEEIFEGTRTERGFYDNEELVKHNSKFSLYNSDLVNLLMDVKGIKNIRRLHFNSFIKDPNAPTTYKQVEKDKTYCIHLNDKEKYAFKLIPDFNTDGLPEVPVSPTVLQIKNKIVFYKEDIKIPIKKASVTDTFLDAIGGYSILQYYPTDLDMPSGKHRALDKYVSIQNEFPVTYRLGKEGISETATTLRKAQRLQLKGYLTFFEQMLADYLAQLNNVKDLLSWRNIENYTTYFANELSANEIEDINKIIADKANLFAHSPGNPSTYNNLTQETEKTRLDRTNRFLDHLLARFQETFVSHSLMRYSKQIFESVFSNTNNPITNEVLLQQEIIDDKRGFLKSYIDISCNRSHAFDYFSGNILYDPSNLTPPVINLAEISGLEKRVNGIIGLNSYNGTPLNAGFKKIAHLLNEEIIYVQGQPQHHYYFASNANKEFDEYFGIHLLEHILLRPKILNIPNITNLGVVTVPGGIDYFGNTDLTKEMLLGTCINSHEKISADEMCYCTDPYSFRATALLPGWFSISQNLNFRTYIERLLREETPAHIALKICWLDPLRMQRYEIAYLAFFKAQQALLAYDDIQATASNLRLNYHRKLALLVTEVNGFKNMYPPAYLNDCDDIVIAENGLIESHPVILNKTSLSGATDIYHIQEDDSAMPANWYYSGRNFSVAGLSPMPSGWSLISGVPNLLINQRPSGWFYNGDF